MWEWAVDTIEQDRLDRVFAALSDRTRRSILSRLSAGEATVTEVAADYPISLPAVSRHLKVLESAGLITRGRHAQYRTSQLRAEPLREAAAWVERYRVFWDNSFDRLEAHLADTDPRRARSARQREDRP
jgi:DNA-binding transcriptional ArsR family regulator